MKEGLCEANPVIATNDPSAGIPLRDRVLNDAEIRAIWNATGDDDFGKIVRLLLLTGCRRDEIGTLQWGEVDLDTGVMIILRRQDEEPQNPGAEPPRHSARHPAGAAAPVVGLCIWPPSQRVLDLELFGREFERPYYRGARQAARGVDVA